MKQCEKLIFFNQAILNESNFIKYKGIIFRLRR